MTYNPLRLSNSCLIFLLLATVTLFGCNREPVYVLVPAKGVVKIAGKPAPNVMVQCMPDALEGNAGPTSSATTNLNGEFELKTTDQKPGAVEGKHIITLFDMDEERPEQGTAATKPPRLDSKYSTGRGGIRYEIKAGSTIDIDIR